MKLLFDRNSSKKRNNALSFLDIVAFRFHSLSFTFEKHPITI